MMIEREDQIRERAFHLWERAGRPSGQDGDFWFQAAAEIDAEAATAGDATTEPIPGGAAGSAPKAGKAEKSGKKKKEKHADGEKDQDKKTKKAKKHTPEAASAEPKPPKRKKKAE